MSPTTDGNWRERMVAVVAPAVARSQTIDEILVDENALEQAGAFYRRAFGDAPALLIADENTWAAAGGALQARLAAADIAVEGHVLPAEPRPAPSVELGESLRERISDGQANPVAVGSGVLNDLVKYAAFQLDRPYLCVATAASMDGYSSAGAPLSDRGFKKTLPCRPPKAILADLSVIAAAPREMTGWGYGDLAGKVPAGGDWLIADALGIEPLDAVAWPLVQGNLRGWLSQPEALAAGDPAATADLFVGLTLSGLAMEFHGSSRPASGADHQIAHLWEMRGLTHRGQKVSHGACVSVGCLAVLRLYDWLLGQDLAALDIEALVAASPDQAAKEALIDQTFANPEIARRAKEETATKHLEPDALRRRLGAIAACWPALRQRLEGHLLRAPEMQHLLTAAGAPTRAAAIGVEAEDLCQTILAARFIRSRYTLLDLLDETGLLADAVGSVFSQEQSAGEPDDA